VLTNLAVAATLVVGQIPVVPVVPPASLEDAQLLRCDGRSGTVWRVSGDRYVTADHVSEGSACTLAGLPIRTIRREEGLDFAVLSTNRGAGRVYEIDCGGFRPFEVYRAIGWARGTDLVAMPVIATGQTWTGEIDGRASSFHALQGLAIPGMSGGPVLSRDGKVVGLVNAGGGGLMLSRPMSETPLCDRSI
jgi:hypothetical protein